MSHTDGTPSADGWHGSGPSPIGTHLTSADGMPLAPDPTSLDDQQALVDVAAWVVGDRPLSDLQVGELAGVCGDPSGSNGPLRRGRDEVGL